MTMPPSLLLLWLVVVLSCTTGMAEDPMSCEAEAQSFPTAKRHNLSLPSGRSLAYYTFGADPQADEGILYLNGFPGSGLEAGVCAGHVQSKPIVAMDRPGLGYTDPAPGVDEEDLFATCNDDVWELANHLKWKTFAVVGVSGGGPHALALLASYLASLDDPNKPKLEKVALVGGVCVSAGKDDMMPVNQKLFDLFQSYQSSRWARFQLGLMFGVPHYLLPILPTFMVHGMIKGNKDLPDVDSTILQDNQQAVEVMSGVIKSAVRQGSAGVIEDARRCFTPKHGFEKILRDEYGSENVQGLPQVSIYQGALDVNVPLSHASYMHEELFHKKSTLNTYEDLGHLSLVLLKAEEYIEKVEKEVQAGSASESSM